MQDFQIKIKTVTGPDARIDGHLVEFCRQGETCVSVTLHERFGADYRPGGPTDQPQGLADKARALMREVLMAMDEGTARFAEDTASEPEQPKGPPFSSAQAEPGVDDAPTVRVTGEGMIRPEG
ncbi:hypothetical protein [Brucella sp. IR073]|uniref:hypothetical protein n=1 Tax=unclassified Brucella TaxID=2632610 RepID=UPI003B981950